MRYKKNLLIYPENIIALYDEENEKQLKLYVNF